MADFFGDLESLRLDIRPTKPESPAKGGEETLRPFVRRIPMPESGTFKSKKKRVEGEFLRGPIPLRWLTSAAGLRGRALNVGLAIWFEAGRQRSTEVILTSAICERFGVARGAKYSGLDSLEEAGLIRVNRRQRKNPVVTLLEDGPG